MTTTLTDRELLSVEKPAQYLGGELNSVIKDEESVDLHFALCFPDTYEVGMSHLGMQILYHIVNLDQRAWGERCYMPQPDMERLQRERGIALASLESRRALSDFDIVGFSLQYELCATNVLAMLDLGGIPLRAVDRTEMHPIVIGGGPYTYHPEALAPFFDVFLLGDAEEAIVEVMETVRRCRAPHNVATREDLLRELDAIEGVYIPSFYDAQFDSNGVFLGTIARKTQKTTVVRRLLPSLVNAPFPTKPIVPNVKAIHNRLSVEVMRGCVRGCRFCQAGYLYRPQRERSPQEILKIVEDALPETGFEELSLLSLSTADYCSVVPLLKSLMDRYGEGDQLAISFPSTRVDALTPEVLEQVQRVRRTNFTVAPEGGTQRLRDVINKGVSDEQILQTCKNVFSMGWSGIKLYFMIGLPTETDQDLDGIVEIAKRIRALPEAHRKDITVNVSTHVPKPHTPFQWAGQISQEETVRKQRYLAHGLRPLGVNFRYHDAFSSFLEGIFCRAGREFSAVIERAYQLGCRMDAWVEQVNQEAWLQACFELGIDPQSYLRERTAEEPLPWDHLSCGISKDYFLREFRRAVRDKTTPDCLKHSCSVCGACDYDSKRNVLFPRWETEAIPPSDQRPVRRDALAEPKVRLRLQYSKLNSMRFVGHLEFAQVLQRACRRADVPLSYSGGFHPFPRMSFGPPIQLGIESEAEYCDIYLADHVEPEDILVRLRAHLPIGFDINSIETVALGAPTIQESISGFEFKVSFITPPRGPLADYLENPTTSKMRALLDLEISRASDRGTILGKRGYHHRFVLRDSIDELFAITADSMNLRYRTLTGIAQPRPTEILQVLTELSIGEYSICKVKSLFGHDGASKLRDRLKLRKQELENGERHPA